jgi:amidase
MKQWLLAGVAVISIAACAPETSNQTKNETDITYSEVSVDTQSYVPTGMLAKTMPEIAAALKAGDISAEDLVKAYIERIEKVDRSGPTLQSVIAVNPDALAEARKLDGKRAAGETLGPLHGVPVLLKDNIESKDNMATTAGALALKDNITGRDSPLVVGLRDAGAIILGKTNLSQWANFRSNDSMSGWTALGGQVRNPHMLDRNPCGSSSGSGAATAASLASATIGTETNGSVICPSNVNGIVGFKPTVGLVSQQYIIPISSSQDTAGPMTKTVTGAAMMLNAMATGAAKTDYVAGLDADKFKGARVGVLRYSVGGQKDIQKRFEEALEVLKAQGAELVEITERPASPDGFGRHALNVLLYEFKSTVNEYLAEAADAVTTRTLKDVMTFNIENADVELALFDQSLFDQAQPLGDLNTPEYIEARDTVQKATREDGIDMLLAKHNVDILVAPSGAIASRVDPINGDVWPNFPGAGSMAAIAGYPNITVPMGTIHGMSVGISFMASKDQDAKVLSFGFAYEQATNLRAEPQYYKTAEDKPEIAKAMKPYSK